MQSAASRFVVSASVCPADRRQLGEILSWNPAAERLFGLPFPRLLAKVATRYSTDGLLWGRK